MSACSSEEPFNPPLPSAATIASPSLSTGPTKPPEPTLPQAAKVNTPAGAEAFARYVIGAYDYAYRSGDGWALLSVAGAKCTFCRSVEQRLSDMRERGTHRVGGRITIEWVSTAPDPQPGTAVFTVAVSQETAKEVDDKGAVIAEFESARDQQLLVALTWDSTKWQLFDIGSEDESR